MPRSGPAVDARSAIGRTVEGLGYELVDVTHGPRGLLCVTIDRLAGRVYPTDVQGAASEAVTVDDCEAVTRQLQYVLEVDGVDYQRLEVSSPGLDRPLRTEAHFARFIGARTTITLKEPFQGRKVWRGVLGQSDAGWTLALDEGQGEQVLGFVLDEVREARLVPVLDFKGRKGHSKVQEAGGTPAAPQDGGVDR